VSRDHRLLLVGCGKHAHETLGPALSHLGVVPAGVADVRLDRANSFRREFAPAAAVAQDWTELLRLDPTAVVAAVDPYVHEDVARTCLANRIPVLVEKPHARTAAIASELHRVAEVHRTRFAAGFNFRYAPSLLAFRRRLRMMTEPLVCSASFWSRHPVAPEFTVRDVREAWLLGNGVHLFDLLALLIEKPEVCGARGMSTRMPDGELTAFHVIARSRAANPVSIVCGSLTPTFSLTVEVRDASGRCLIVDGLDRVLASEGGWAGSPTSRRIVEIWKPRENQSRMRLNGHVGQLAAFLILPFANHTLATGDDAAAAIAFAESVLAVSDQAALSELG
jgi:predicted dehydrogenase